MAASPYTCPALRLTRRRDGVSARAQLMRCPDDPAAWGYRPMENGTPLVPITGQMQTQTQTPFRLQLMGQPVPEGELDVPVELSSVVSIHQRLTYPEYYRLLSQAVSRV